MSQQQFDNLTRSIATSVSRRHALKAIAGGVLGAAGATLLGSSHAEATSGHCKHSDSNCTHNSECCTSICLSASNGVVCGFGGTPPCYCK